MSLRFRRAGGERIEREGGRKDGEIEFGFEPPAEEELGDHELA